MVVDDHDMGVTHIIRGDDHLTNAARQTIIYDAMGWQVPDGVYPAYSRCRWRKASKRCAWREAYRAMGYPPEALLNYLARLGWSYETTEMSIAQMTEWFDITDVNKAAFRLLLLMR